MNRTIVIFHRFCSQINGEKEKGEKEDNKKIASHSLLITRATLGERTRYNNSKIIHESFEHSSDKAPCGEAISYACVCNYKFFDKFFITVHDS